MQQLVVAALARKRAQLAGHGTDYHALVRHPAVGLDHAGAVAGKQAAGDFGLIASKGADQAQGVEISGHGAFSPGRGVTR